MSALAPTPTVDQLTFTLTLESHVRASLKNAFEALLDGTRNVDSGAMADELRFVDGPRSIMFCSDIVLRLGA